MIEVSEKYRDIKNLTLFPILEDNGLALLKETVESFLNCDVSFLDGPIEQSKIHFGLDLHQNPKRGCYPISDDCFFIYARILKENTLISGLGLVLRGEAISEKRNFLNHFEGALTNKITESFHDRFANCSLVFGEDLIVHSITNYCIRGYFDYRKFYHLISLFKNIHATTFEGKSFSTGLILTKSHYAYNKKRGHNRFGDLLKLDTKKNIRQTLKIDRRFWYLADGKHTYFTSNKDLEIENIFVLDDNYQDVDYIDSNSLSLTLKGGDVLFRIENEKQFSIVNSDGIEFLSIENQWKFRDYNIIKKYISNMISDENVVNRLLFFVLFCSKNSISSIVWLPGDLNKIEEYVKPETMNRLVEKPISILDARFTSHIVRYLSSDGACILDCKGNLLYYGSIVDISKLEIQGVKGTGESAAQVLSKNGMSFKVSEDGAIKMFMPGSTKPFLI